MFYKNILFLYYVFIFVFICMYLYVFVCICMYYVFVFKHWIQPASQPSESVGSCISVD
jgi:hypothetical protein